MTVKDLKTKTHKIYKSLGSMWCPAVKNNVVFNAYGWVHLGFDGRGHRRTDNDLRLRLQLLPFVPEVVKNAKVQSKPGEARSLKIKDQMRQVTYFEIAQACDGGKKHVTVILRKIAKGKLHYYSVRRTSNKIKKALANAGLN